MHNDGDDDKKNVYRKRIFAACPVDISSFFMCTTGRWHAATVQATCRCVLCSQ